MSGVGVKRRLEKMEGPVEGTFQNLKLEAGGRTQDHGNWMPSGPQTGLGRPERSPASNKYRGQRGNRAASRREKKRWRRWKWDRQPDKTGSQTSSIGELRPREGTLFKILPHPRTAVMPLTFVQGCLASSGLPPSKKTLPWSPFPKSKIIC